MTNTHTETVNCECKTFGEKNRYCQYKKEFIGYIINQVMTDGDFEEKQVHCNVLCCEILYYIVQCNVL